MTFLITSRALCRVFLPGKPSTPSIPTPSSQIPKSTTLSGDGVSSSSTEARAAGHEIGQRLDGHPWCPGSNVAGSTLLCFRPSRCTKSFEPPLARVSLWQEVSAPLTYWRLPVAHRRSLSPLRPFPPFESPCLGRYRA